MKLAFTDRMPLEVLEDGVKTGLSMRDGVIQYTGAELGMEPADKLFTVYRSPATIANAAMRLIGVPLTDGHQPPEGEVTDPKGEVTATELVTFNDEDSDARLAVRNQIRVDDGFIPVISNPEGPRELSLGYRAELVEHDKHDFEQVGIQPHHLAAVPAGRCGPVCSFVDHNTREVSKVTTKKNPKLKTHKAFCDENGEVNIQEVVDIATRLPEALREMPLDELRKLVPILKKALEGADESVVEQGGESQLQVAEEVDVIDEEEQKKKFEDAVSKAVTASVDAAVKQHAEVIEKARSFVDESYSFAGKTTVQIMRDAVATQSAEKFTDSELPLAFKMLRPSAGNPALKDFGDGQAVADRWSNFGKKEVK